MKVHLVDGTYELFRAYFGPPSATDPSGREVGATRGLMRSLASLLDEPEVTHVGVAFDTVIESFRNELFEGYKTGEGLPEELTSQFPLAEDACEAMGLLTWRMVDFEADDALATAAARCADEGRVDQVILCSPDKDLAQCVRDDQVITRDRMRRKELDATAVEEKFGVLPTSIPDWLALVGDSADGIPGIPRWGAKSAAKVLREHGSIEAIPEEPEKWGVEVRGAASLAAELTERRDEALLYKQLATLRNDVPIEASLDALEWKGPADDLDAFCDSIGARRPF